MSEIPYIQGYNVKPYYISPMGVVVFTDGNRKSGGGSSEFAPNQKQCEAYGYTYDASRDAFIPPQTFPSWTLNETTCVWNPPIAYPTDGQHYRWNDETKSWDLIPNS